MLTNGNAFAGIPSESGNIRLTVGTRHTFDIGEILEGLREMTAAEPEMRMFAHATGGSADSRTTAHCEGDSRDASAAGSSSRSRPLLPVRHGL
jgi:hypothetical protein